jgi:hypothetical protein
MAPPPGAGGPDSSIPPGLEYLTQLDQILVKQTVELLEAFTGFEQCNKYKIFNVMGQQCYFAHEESGCLARQCCKQHRGFIMKVLDNTQREVIRVTRNFKCCATRCCWCACCGCTQNEILVEAPPGVIVGRVHQKCSGWRATYGVEMGSDIDDMKEIFELVGPFCMCRCCCFCCDYDFKVFSSETTDEVGKLVKQNSGFAKEMFTDADNFSVSFPKDLDVRAKAIMMCAIFLIDFVYFEDNEPDQKKL